MPGPAAILKQAHHLRRYITELDAKIEQAPKQIAIQHKKLANQDDANQQAHEHVKQLALTIREKEGAIKATQTQIKKYEKQMDEAANKKEYDTLNSEIAQEKAHISKTEDEILAMMTENEEKTAQLPEADRALQKARAAFAQFEKDHAEKLERFKTERARTLDEIKSAEATLPEDVRAQYARLLSAKGIDALSGVTSRTCAACYTEITSQMLSELKLEMYVLCKNCGRILYLES